MLGVLIRQSEDYISSMGSLLPGFSLIDAPVIGKIIWCSTSASTTDESVASLQKE